MAKSAAMRASDRLMNQRALMPTSVACGLNAVDLKAGSIELTEAGFNVSAESCNEIVSRAFRERS